MYMYMCMHSDAFVDGLIQLCTCMTLYVQVKHNLAEVHKLSVTLGYYLGQAAQFNTLLRRTY